MTVQSIQSLMTPKHIMCSQEHEQPFIIFPHDFKSFNDIFSVRFLIRDLKLVPIKSDEMQLKYHSIDKTELLKSINFGDKDIILLENQFPYQLPNDVGQKIIWIKPDVSEETVIDFIQQKIAIYGDNIILFERPSNIKTKLVKGSFPLLRHVHFWHQI